MSDSPPNRPNAIRAFLLALGLALVAWKMLQYGELRRFELLLFVYPPLIGALSVWAWRDARRTWVALRDEPESVSSSGGVGLLKLFTWLALAIDVLLMLSVIVLVYGLINGPWVA